MYKVVDVVFELVCDGLLVDDVYGVIGLYVICYEDYVID